MRNPGILVRLAACFVLSACAAEPPPPPLPPPPPPPPPVQIAPLPAKPPPETVSVDTPRTTAAGTMFTVPAGWTADIDGVRAVLTPPEGDFKLAVVDTPAQAADDAINAGWQIVHPGFKRPLHIAEPVPARRGWDERRSYDYETSPDEKLAVFGVALRQGQSWVAFLAEGNVATLEKRGGTVNTIAQSVSPRGYARESFAGKAPHPLDAARLQQITDFVQQGQKLLDVPGVAIGLVQDGRVVFQGGFGVKEMGKPAKVDADTLFMIASNTKALTTLLLAKEIDEGKFTWNTPATSVYPEFKLGDAATTAQVQMKHLVCACTGMPREDLPWIFEYARATPRSVMDLLGTMQPTSKFGEAFQYSNLMASAAGFIGGHAAFPKEALGTAYDDAMKAKIFGPLGMTSTTFDFARAMKGNHATPHSFDIDGNVKVANDAINHAIGPARPAGAAWSSVRDMLRYVQMELAKGKLPNGKPLLSEENLMARRAPQIQTGEFTSYAMALSLDREWGVSYVHHGGDLVGFHSDMFWIPDAGVGGVILTDADRGWALRRPFIRKVFEQLFDGRSEAQGDVATTAANLKAELAKERERLAVPPAADVVAKLASRYHSDALGDVTVMRSGSGCVLDVGEWKSAVATRKNDDGTTSIVTTDPGLDDIGFVVAERDGKRALVIRDAQHEYVFKETP